LNLCRFSALALPLLAAGVVAPAQAGEVQFDGFYRARARAFSSLSIDPSLDNAEGPSAWVQHRFWLQPRFVVNDKVAVYSEFRALDGVPWGRVPDVDQVPRFWNGPGGAHRGQPELPRFFDDDLRSPGTATTDFLPRGAPDISLWRVWAEVHGETGTWRFGRMPVHWGLGVWQNDGLGLNADYGDSADRVQWERAFGDVFLRAAGEVNAFNLADATIRDTVSGNATIAYRGERVEVGLNTQVRRVLPGGGTNPVGGFTLGTGSAALHAEAGNLRVGAELVGRVGKGALDASNTAVDVQAFGGVVAADMALEKITFGLEAGFASGDGDSSDDTIRTFTFDRDYNIGVILFEQPMPILRTSAGARDASQLLTGNGISNALFARAHGSYALPHGVSAEIAVALANTFRLDEELRDRSFYGVEFDLGARYRATDNLDLVGTSALFVPGSFYGNHRPPDVTSPLQNGVRGVVFGGQVLARVRF